MVEWHTKTSQEVIDELHTKEEGLDATEVKTRLTAIGPNELKKKKRFTALTLLLNQFKSFLILILAVAVVISYAIGNITDAILILIIIVINATLGFVQEFRAERAIEALKKISAPHAKVFRNGEEKVISAEGLVPGDIVVIEEGDKIPADARIIEVSNLKVDESSLTGESIPITKTETPLKDHVSLPDRKNMLYMGTVATYGRAKAVIVETGMNTEIGKIAELIQTGERETPLQAKVNAFGKWLGVVALGAAGIVFLIGFTSDLKLSEMFLTSAALAVSAVPEGLPALLTITLALGVQKMSKKNSIMRKLSAVETLGSTTVIAADKTGTMTANEMTVRKIYVNSEFIEVSGVGFEPEGEFTSRGMKTKPNENNELALALQISILCNNAVLTKDDKWGVIGDPTEGALVVVAKKAGLDQKKLEEKYPRISEIPFSSERKMMSTINKVDRGKFVYSKGAPEIVLDRCSYILRNSREVKLVEQQRKKILSVTEQMAKDGLRVLAVAYKKSLEKEFHPKAAEQDLIFVGLIGMIDPPRKEVKEAIAVAREAGIRTIMITGDHKDTAIAVATKIGLYKEGQKVLTGEELDKINDKEFEDIVEDVNVFSRVSPIHKSRIITSLKKKGHIVAVTGDGVNDAPALKDAHIGVAMGVKGTDVAKEASEMILADDNFATIVKSVEEGRTIYDNIRKFIRYILTANFDEIFLITAAILFGFPLPLLAVQILWLNLLTDGLPALALGVDPPERDIMKRKPRNPRHGILKGMIFFILAGGILAFLTESVAFVWTCTNGFSASCVADSQFYPKALTMALTTAIMFELILSFNCRSEKYSVWRTHPFSNKFLILSILATILIHASIVYVPVFNSFFHTVPLGLFDWLMVVALASTGLFVLPRIFIR